MESSESSKLKDAMDDEMKSHMRIKRQLGSCSIYSVKDRPNEID